MDMNTVGESRTYIDVLYRDKSAARKLGAQWDPDERQWFIPADVPPERFKDFHAWFSCWQNAPECPTETDPIKWGRALFSDLQRWGREWRLAPETLAYWDITQGTPAIEECCSEHSVVQILWPRGPSLWAVRLLERQRYRDCFDGTGYFLEAIDEWSFDVGKVD
jgi:hypothetical protein